MGENEYILDILSGLGFAINEKNNSEIIINYPIKFDKKSMEFCLSSDYKITLQPIATFLADFLNCNFDDYDEFLNFFCKYSLSLLDYKKLVRTFKNNTCSSKEFEQFVLNLLSKNKNHYRKLQEQTDMILDYCLINPSKRALEFKPIEAEDIEQLKVALSRLRSKYRNLLELRYYQGLSYKELSAKLDTPVGTIKSDLSKAKRKLKELFHKLSN